MRRFVLRRLAMLPVVAFGVTILLMSLLQALPPEMRAALYIKDPRQLSAVKEIIEKHHLSAPVYVQYWDWLKEVAHGNLGYSETAKMPVTEAIAAFFPATLELTAAAFIPIVLIGIWLGTLSAVHKDSATDHISRFIAVTGYSLPSFVLGLLLLMIFYGRFRLFPPGRYGLESDLLIHSASFRHYTGFLLVDSLMNFNPTVFFDALKHLFLPAITLIYINLALLLRITRSAMLEELRKDYVRTARAKGLTEDAIIARHARRNAMIPIITLSSLLLVGLLGGVVVTETVFDFPGIGRWGVAAAQQLDIPGLMGSALLSSILFVASNFAADMLYAFVDPRIRVQ